MSTSVHVRLTNDGVSARVDEHTNTSHRVPQHKPSIVLSHEVDTGLEKLLSGCHGLKCVSPSFMCLGRSRHL